MFKIVLLCCEHFVDTEGVLQKLHATRLKIKMFGRYIYLVLRKSFSDFLNSYLLIAIDINIKEKLIQRMVEEINYLNNMFLQDCEISFISTDIFFKIRIKTMYL